MKRYTDVNEQIKGKKTNNEAPTWLGGGQIFTALNMNDMRDQGACWQRCENVNQKTDLRNETDFIFLSWLKLDFPNSMIWLSINHKWFRKQITDCDDWSIRFKKVLKS